MGMGDLMKGIGGDQLRSQELEMIDEGIGLNDISEIINDQEARRNLGLGEDFNRARDTKLIGPKLQEVVERMEPPKRKRPPIPSEPKRRGPTGPGTSKNGTGLIKTVRSITVIPDDVIISNFQVAGATPTRVDVGLSNRTDILIANMSLSPVWVNTVSTINPNGVIFVGVPLKAMSGANQFDGGVMRLSITEQTRFWAQATAPGNFLVVTIETALKNQLE